MSEKIWAGVPSVLMRWTTLLAVKFQHRLGFLLVGFQALADDVEVRVVEPVFLEGAALHARRRDFSGLAQ